MSAWPSTLPKPLLSGYGDKPATAFIRTNMDAGAARQRKRFTAAPHSISAKWILNAAQMVIFKYFFETTINMGADWFTATLDTGDGLIAYDTRFEAPYTAARLGGGYWEVSGQLELRGA